MYFHVQEFLRKVKTRQAQLKCVLFSIYFFLWCVFMSALHFQDWSNLSYHSSVSWEGRSDISVTSLNFMWISIFLLHASFIVRRLRDIFNLEVIESTQNCFLKHLPFITIVLVILMDMLQGAVFIPRWNKALDYKPWIYKPRLIMARGRYINVR